MSGARIDEEARKAAEQWRSGSRQDCNCRKCDLCKANAREMAELITAAYAERTNLLDGSGTPVTPEKQAAAVKAWAEYWGSACPDCGPQDYEAMLQHALIRNTR